MSSFESKDFQLHVEAGNETPDPLASFERVDEKDKVEKDTGPYKKLLQIFEDEDGFFDALHNCKDIKETRIKKFGVEYNSVKALRDEINELQAALNEMKENVDMHKEMISEVEEDVKQKEASFDKKAVFIAKEYHDILELQKFQDEAA